MDGILEIERVGQRRDVGGIGVHLVAGVGLARAAMAAPVMGNDAIAFAQEEHELIVPVIGAQRPAMMEDDRLGVLGPGVLVENLGAVRSRDERHIPGPLLMEVGSWWRPALQSSGPAITIAALAPPGTDKRRKKM